MDSGPPPRESDVREKLKAFLSGPSHMSPAQLSLDIGRIWSRLYPADVPKKPPSRRTIERFLKGREGSESIGPHSFLVIYRYLVRRGAIIDKTIDFPVSRDPTFEALCALYGVDPAKMEAKAADYAGTFEFFAWSEDFEGAPRDYVVRGALTFNLRPEDGAAVIEEVQRGNVSGEKWDGYFLEYNDTTCMIFAYRLPSRVPKIYILKFERWAEADNKVHQLTGRMVKAGVFFSGVTMNRRDDAVARCAVIQLPSPEVSRETIDRIGRRPRIPRTS